MKEASNNIFWIFLVIALLALGYGTATYFVFATWSDRGTFGDMFGGLNALFSGLAFGGIIYTIFLQREELQLQRNELELTRQELRRTAEAQEKSEQALTKQVQSMERTAKLNALSSLLEHYSEITSRNSLTPQELKEAVAGIPECKEKIRKVLNELGE